MKGLLRLDILFTLGLALLLAGCGYVWMPLPQCSKHSDCPAQNRCVQKACEPVKDGTRLCQNDNECSSPYTCVKGICTGSGEKGETHPRSENTSDAGFPDNPAEQSIPEQTPSPEKQQKESVPEQPQNPVIPIPKSCNQDKEYQFGIPKSIIAYQKPKGLQKWYTVEHTKDYKSAVLFLEERISSSPMEIKRTSVLQTRSFPRSISRLAMDSKANFLAAFVDGTLYVWAILKDNGGKWRLSTPKTIRDKTILQIAFRPNSSELFVVYGLLINNRPLKVQNTLDILSVTQTGGQLTLKQKSRHPLQEKEHISVIRFHPNGKQVAMSSNRQLYVYSLDALKLRKQVEIKPYAIGSPKILFHPLKDQIIIAPYRLIGDYQKEQILKIDFANSGSDVKKSSKSYPYENGSCGLGYTCQFWMNSESGELYSIARGLFLKWPNASGQQPIQPQLLKSSGKLFTLATKLGYILIVHPSGWVNVLDPKNNKILHRQLLLQIKYGEINRIHLFNNEKYLLVWSSGKGRLELWEWKTKGKIFNFEKKQTLSESNDLRPLFTTSQNEQFIAWGAGRNIEVWKTSAPFGVYKHFMTLRGHQQEVFHLAMAPHGKWLLSMSKDNEMRLWLLNDSRTSRVLTHPLNNIAGLKVFEQSGKNYILVFKREGSVKAWQVPQSSPQSLQTIALKEELQLFKEKGILKKFRLDRYGNLMALKQNTKASQLKWFKLKISQTGQGSQLQLDKKQLMFTNFKDLLWFDFNPVRKTLHGMSANTSYQWTCSFQ